MNDQQPQHVDATFYAVVRPEWHRWRKDDKNRPILASAKVERITQNRPNQVAGDAVVTRLTLRVDAVALLPLQPQAIVHITADDVDVITVTADAPEDGDQ
jgi:hypothetical protein